MGWQLPDNVNPPDTVCVQFQVPNDPKYLQAFWGAVLDLTVGFNWANDSAHTARLAARRMRQMYLDAQLGNCPPGPIAPGFFLEDCMNIKQDPTNPCLLREVCPDGTLGCTIFDASLCNPNPAPGGGVTPPSAGGCTSFKFSADSRTLTPLPFVVNAGDTLQFTSIQGASTDGSGHWYCPDGEIFLLGACAGGGNVNGADPLPTTFHQALLLKIGANFYPLTSALFTVPGGVTNAPIYVQTNDAALTSNVGTYSLVVTYCNNLTPSAPWCRLLDMTLSPNSGVASTGTDANGHHHPNPYWTGGVGWQADLTLIAPSATNENEPRVVFDLGAVRTINFAQINGHVYAGGGGQADVFLQASNDPTFAAGVVNLAGGFGQPLGADFALGGTIAAVNYRYLRFYTDYYSSTAALIPGVKFTQMTIKGTGAAPTLGAGC